MKSNFVWDGLFHACTWVVTVVGIALLSRASKRGDVPRSGRIFVGSLSLAGLITRRAELEQRARSWWSNARPERQRPPRRCRQNCHSRRACRDGRCARPSVRRVKHAS
ncbi:MAG: DUF2243 domain-containing protein [Sandaracinaceae bacterium]|nr:DUF2243 domain-containing protein [Sandaracinaceae bacterium]